MAVEGGHCDCVDVLIEEGASVDLPRHVSLIAPSETVLFLYNIPRAISCHGIREALHLINVAPCLKDGRGPLLLACLAGNENITRRLVLAGADVDVQERVSLKKRHTRYCSLICNQIRGNFG